MLLSRLSIKKKRERKEKNLYWEWNIKLVGVSVPSCLFLFLDSISIDIYPFLAVAICKIIDSLRIPLLPNTEQIQGQKSVFSHDDKVDEEARCGLDHADLTVCHWNEPRRRQIYWRTFFHGSTTRLMLNSEEAHFLPGTYLKNDLKCKLNIALIYPLEDCQFVLFNA